MTLILGMSKAEGVYLSADFRVTEYPAGRLIDDASGKMLTVHYPPDQNGARAVLAFTGIAILPDGTPTGTWIRETLRGESEYPDQSMAHLKARLDRDIAPLRVPLIINVLIVEPARRLFGGLSNLARDETARGGVGLLPMFGYVMTELTEPFAFVNGSGAVRALADKHLDLARAQLEVRPRKALDHMKLLASINRRVAAKEKSVSPACHVAFVPAKAPTPGATGGQFGPTSHTFTQRGEAAPAVMPMLLFGIDLTGMMLQTVERLKAMDSGDPGPANIDIGELNRSLQRRP